MKRFPFLVLLVLLPLFLSAQERQITVRRFDVNLGDMRAKAEPVLDIKGKPTALIEIFISAKDTLHIEGNIREQKRYPGKWDIYLPEGSQWIDITMDGCAPLHFEFPDDKLILSAHTYVLELSVEEHNPMRTLIMPSFGYNKSQFSYGLLLAICKKNGGYLRAKTDFNFILNPAYTCDDSGVVDGVWAWFNGESKKSRLAITAGYMRQIIDPLYIYFGGGWGTRVFAWQMYVEDNVYDWARVSSKSFTGLEVELGAVFRLGSFAVSAGVQANSFKYVEANFGIGVMF